MYAWKVAGTHIIVYVYLFVCVCVDNPSRFCNHLLHFDRQCFVAMYIDSNNLFGIGVQV